MAANLRGTRHRPIPVAINIGKNKVTPNERAQDDYRECIRVLYPSADFFCGEHLFAEHAGFTQPAARQRIGEPAACCGRGDEYPEASSRRRRQTHPGKKIAPDLKDEEIDYMIDTIMNSGVSGIVAANTTVSREGLAHSDAKESGGLSGRPLTFRSMEIIRKVFCPYKGITAHYRRRRNLHGGGRVRQNSRRSQPCGNLHRFNLRRARAAAASEQRAFAAFETRRLHSYFPGGGSGRSLNDAGGAARVPVYPGLPGKYSE